MFAWPTLELTDYEQKFVRYYKQPKLDAQGRVTNETWPGVLKRVYKAQLYNQNIPTIARFNNGPVFEERVLISRRSRVFGFTFSGDTANWFLEIETASGEKFTNAPCLVSAMQAGSYYNANANIGTPTLIADPFGAGSGIVDLFFGGSESFGIMVEPNYQLLPNEALIFRGTLAEAIADRDSIPFTQLTIGIHVWEFPGMANPGGTNLTSSRSV